MDNLDSQIGKEKKKLYRVFSKNCTSSFKNCAHEDKDENKSILLKYLSDTDALDSDSSGNNSENDEVNKNKLMKQQLLNYEK